MYTLLLILIYIAFISLGLPDSLLGSGWPVMYPSLNVQVSYMGVISMTIAGSTIISSLLSDKLNRKFGTRIVTVISVFLTAFSLLGFSLSNEFWMLVVLSIPFGLGAGAIDAALNNYIALHYTSKHMSWLHCFWGVGTIISPFIMSYAVTNLTWNNGYRIVSFIQMGIGLLLLITLPVWKINQRKADAATKAKSVGLTGVLKIKGVPFLLIGFFAYCAAEATAMNWVSVFMVKVKGFSAEDAARYASLFFIGITVGRFIGGFIMNRLGDRRMIILGACILMSGILLISFPFNDKFFSLFGFLVIGLGCAPVYPCIIHSTPGNFGTENSGSIIGIQMASAYVGSTFLPPLFGLLGHQISFKILPFFLAFFIIIMIAMIELTFRTTGKNKSKNV